MITHFIAIETHPISAHLIMNVQILKYFSISSTFLLFGT